MKYILLFSLLLLGSTSVVSAQVVQYGQTQLSIDLQPAHPGPEDYFTATANDYALPIQGSTIRWYVDGELLEEAINQRVITLQAKQVGESTNLELRVTVAGGGVVTIKREVSPVYLDIILEPQTRTPAFYQGRALPSIGSVINATAIINGNAILPSSLMYTWRLNGKVLEYGTLQGKNNISFPMPQGRFATLALEVREIDGDPIAGRVFDVPSVTPTLHFYEISSLYGFKLKAIADSTPLIGSSVTVRAEPYNLDLATYNNPGHLEWKIAGRRSPSNNNNPYEVTLAAEGGTGAARIDFHVRNLVQVLQGSQGGFQITYGNTI